MRWIRITGGVSWAIMGLTLITAGLIEPGFDSLTKMGAGAGAGALLMAKECFSGDGR